MSVDEDKRIEDETTGAGDGSKLEAANHKRKSAEPGDERVVEGDPDDETWTNQPKQSDDTPREGSDESEEDLDDDEEELPPAPRKPIQNGRDVICEELPARASRAKLRLHSYLKAALVVELANSGDRFLFDWRGEEPKVTPYESREPVSISDGAGSAGVDSFVAITEQNLMAIRSGDLNPQVAMLADKIKVRGKMSPAVYLFNLIAPRVRD
jgi:hypothetical protein